MPDRSMTTLNETRRRVLAWEGCLNARDLGGYPTSEGRVTKWGAVVRSDLLSNLTSAGQESLRAHGIRTIIDLRMESELLDEPNPFATPGDHRITYLHRSFIDGSEPEGLVGTLAEDYISSLQRHRATIPKIMSAIAKAADGGVLIHCHGGRDRTGTIAAFLLDLAGVPRMTIANDYALSTECLRPRDEHYLEHGPGDRAERASILERFKTRPEVMLETLAWVDASYGGVAAYLRHTGVAEFELESIRHRLVDHSNG